MKISIIVCGIFLIFITSAIPNIMEEKAQKVKVDLYFESLCNACQIFIKNSLKKAAATKGFWDICQFNLYPYGNAKRKKVDFKWQFKCQHGVSECEGNFIETCVIKKYDFYSQALPFIICLEAGSYDWNETGQKCASHLDLDWKLISTCATGSEGVKYMLQMAEATQKLDPPHKWVPWVTINGEHNEEDEDAILANMVGKVCQVYKGPRPQFCEGSEM